MPTSEDITGSTGSGASLAPKQEADQQTMLVSFESGHYKKITGRWKGDSVWTHWIKPNGKQIHINKDKVEYYEEL